MLNPNKKGDITGLSDVETKELVKLSQFGKIRPYSTPKTLQRSKKDILAFEVAGMPRVYKTTLIVSSIVHFRTKDVKTWFTEERPYYIDKRKYPLLYSIGIANNTMRSLLSQRERDLFLLDRGIYDQIAFLHAYRSLQVISRKTFDLGVRYLIGVHGDLEHALLICHNKPKVSLKREGPRKKRGHVMNTDFLSALQAAYKKLPQTVTKYRRETGFAKKPLPIVELDSTIKWEEYSSLFLKTMGTFYKIHTAI